MLVELLPKTGFRYVRYNMNESTCALNVVYSSYIVVRPEAYVGGIHVQLD